MTVPKHILAATDFSETSERAVEFAANLASKLGARLTVVHTFEAPYPYPVPLPQEYKQDLRADLEKRCAPLRARLGLVDAVLREGAPWDEIVSLASEIGADWIVVGTHGRRGLPRMLLGSVAERVVRMSPVPVVTVPSATPGKP